MAVAPGWATCVVCSMDTPATVLLTGGEKARSIACGNRSCAVVTAKSGSVLSWVSISERSASDLTSAVVRDSVSSRLPLLRVRLRL